MFRCLEAVLGRLGPPWGVFGPSWVTLGPFRGGHKAVLGCLGPSWGRLGTILDRFRACWGDWAGGRKTGKIDRLGVVRGGGEGLLLIGNSDKPLLPWGV